MVFQAQTKVDKEQKIKKLTDDMNESIKQYKTDPKDEMELLESLSKFKDYSTKNTILIKSQYKGAYGVASYKDFQKLGYQVQKGEKSISILAPSMQKLFEDEKGASKPLKYATKEQKEKIKRGVLKKFDKMTKFIPVPVFDVTQTNCPPEDYAKLYPNKPENFKFEGTEEEFETFNQALHSYAKEQGILVESGKTDSAAKGYYVPSTNEIMLKDRLHPHEKVKVLLHELAHAGMHNYPKMATKNQEMQSVNVLEYQAEMTAYVVSKTFGLDSEDYSTSYLAGWTKREVENPVYIQSLQEVKDVSLNMIDKIVEKYNDRTQQVELSVEETIATKLNFLTDETGINHFSELKDEPLICTGIEKVKSAKWFADYNIKLEDKNGNSFNYHIRSEKSKKELNQEWSKEWTGKEWLNQDIKTEVLKRKPTLVIDNPIPEYTENMEPLFSYAQEQKVPQIPM